MFSLRRGTSALAHPDAQRRLSELSREQLLIVCERLQNFKSEIATAWTPAEVKALVSVWSTIRDS
jgi:hypothetical protein